jgi:hypothetical protein
MEMMFDQRQKEMGKPSSNEMEKHNLSEIDNLGQMVTKGTLKA